MTHIGDITLLVLCAAMFSAYVGVSLDLSLQLTAMLSIALTIGISIPDLELALEAAIEVGLGIDLGVSIGLPSVTADLSVSFDAELVIVLGLVAALEALVAVTVSGPALNALSYSGPGTDLGAAVTSVLASGWADGTSPSATVFALVLAATSSGTTPVGSVASYSMLGGGPCGSGYERGLCSVTVSAPLSGVTATATPTISGGVIQGLVGVVPGTGYVTPATVTISDTVPLTDATNASPIVVTLADTTDVTSVTIAGVLGNTAANGMWCAKVLSGTTLALYQDSAFTVPVVGNGAYGGGGTVTGNGSGAAAIAIMGGGAKAQLRGFCDGVTFGTGLVSMGVTSLGVMFDATFSLLLDLLGELQLQAKIMASAKLNFGIVPPTISGNVSIAASIVANLRAALGFIPPLPSIQANLSAAFAGKIAIFARLMAAIGAQLGFATENLGIYTYEGPGSGLGTALASTFPTDVDLVLIGATTPAANDAITIFFPAAA